MASQDVAYIYKIVAANPPLPITATNTLPDDYVLPASDLDKKSGFMHMSTKPQVAGTLNKFFSTSNTTADSVYLLKVPLQPLEDKGLIRWEAPDASVCGPRGGEGMFAHIYDDHQYRLTHVEVESAIVLTSPKGDDTWDASLSKISDQGWFV